MRAKQSFKLRQSIMRLGERYQPASLFFLTLTPKGRNWDYPELFKKQTVSFRNNVLRRNGLLFIWRAEAQRNGRLHIHMIVVLPWEAGGEYDQRVHGMGKSSQYEIERLYSGRLKDLSKMLRSKANSYGIGRFNFLPVRNLEKLSTYMTKDDPNFHFKDVRTHGISKELRAIKGDIAFVSKRSEAFRRAMGTVGRMAGCPDADAMKLRFGSKWCFGNLGHYFSISRAIQDDDPGRLVEALQGPLLLYRGPNGKPREHIDLWKLRGKTLTELGLTQSRRKPALGGHTSRNLSGDTVRQRAEARQPNRAQRYQRVDSGPVPSCDGDS